MNYPTLARDITFSLQDFTQINLEVNRHLVNSVISLLDLKKDDRVLDAFCGIGNFSLPIARTSAFVYGVEYSESSVKGGRELTPNSTTSIIVFFKLATWLQLVKELKH